MYIKNKRGQSTVEYVLLVTAVIAVIIALVTSNNGGLKGQLNSTYNSALTTVSDITGRLQNSEGPSNPGGTGTPPYSINAAP